MKSNYLHIMFSQINTYLKPGLVQDRYRSVKKDMNPNPKSQGFVKMSNNILTVTKGNNKRYPYGNS